MKELIKVLSVAIAGVLAMPAFGQQDPHFTQYSDNMLFVNPAYAGSRGAVNLNYFGRSQWSGIPGAPKTNSISLDGSNIKGNMGLGVQVYNDQIGVFKRNGMNLMASSRVKISDNGVLSGGIQLGVLNQRNNLSDVANVYDRNDPKFQENKSVTDATLGAGVFYNTDKFYAGFSVPNVLKSRLTAFDVMNSGIQKVNSTHIFFTSGYVFDVNEDVKIKPSTMIKAVGGAPIEADFNTNVWLKNVIRLGFSYRTGDAMVAMAEAQINNNLRVGYAYDITISPLKYYNNGSHELMFRYEFGNNNTKIKSTRYF